MKFDFQCYRFIVRLLCSLVQILRFVFSQCMPWQKQLSWNYQKHSRSQKTKVSLRLHVHSAWLSKKCNCFLCGFLCGCWCNIFTQLSHVFFCSHLGDAKEWCLVLLTKTAINRRTLKKKHANLWNHLVWLPFFVQVSSRLISESSIGKGRRHQ